MLSGLTRATLASFPFEQAITGVSERATKEKRVSN